MKIILEQWRKYLEEIADIDEAEEEDEEHHDKGKMSTPVGGFSTVDFSEDDEG
jgi:hypothetical protein